jgi:hypothetical protein
MLAQSHRIQQVKDMVCVDSTRVCPYLITAIAEMLRLSSFTLPSPPTIPPPTHHSLSPQPPPTPPPPPKVLRIQGDPDFGKKTSLKTLDLPVSGNSNLNLTGNHTRNLARAAGLVLKRLFDSQGTTRRCGFRNKRSLRHATEYRQIDLVAKNFKHCSSMIMLISSILRFVAYVHVLSHSNRKSDL